MAEFTFSCIPPQLLIQAVASRDIAQSKIPTGPSIRLIEAHIAGAIKANHERPATRPVIAQTVRSIFLASPGLSAAHWLNIDK